ncbi:MAG TPA: MMPL family transporter [Actinomycetota bacterium]|nr:MMPL family transporter [Actinomycetota bacterium]
MLSRLGRFVLRRRWAILAATLAAVALAGAFGGGAIGHLKSGGFEDPAAESVKAAAVLRGTFGTGDPNLVLLVTAKNGDVDDPAVTRRGQELTRRLAAEPDLTQVASYWSLHAPSLRSEDGRQALVLGRVTGDEEGLDERAKQLTAAYAADGPDVRVQVGGQIQVFREVGEQVERDLVRAEGIAIPITLLLLVVVFSSAVAGMLPVAVALLAIVGTLLLLRLLGDLTDVSIYALNLTTALGLGLAIDYSLFIVSRYREELRAGREPADALLVTMGTAGRTVLFSAATVAVALLALLVFPLYFLRSFGYAGIAVVALAAVGALVVLPALLAVLGRRVDRLRLPVGRRRRYAAGGGGFWHRVATGVMRRPLPIAAVVVGLLLLLGTPFLGVSFGLPDDRVLSAGAVSRQVSDALRTSFAADESSAVSLVATGTGDPTGRLQDIDRYASALSRLDGVSRVDALSGSYADGRRLQGPPPGPDGITPAARRFGGSDGTWLSLVFSVEPYSAAGEDLVARVRALPDPLGVQVTGQAAQLVDTKASLAGHLPAAGAIIALVTSVLLFLFTGSVVIPLKALVLNLLSLTAVYGAMVFVFQDGHLADVLGFTATGTIDTSMPVLMFCIAFGLSMDYEVFLLSRIKEEHDRTGDTVAAVAVGLERSGRIVTAAAALLAIVFAAFATAQVSFLQLFGVGAALAVVVDATLIRALLVPAFMRLAGQANWWAPAPLRRLHRRVGLREAAPEAVGTG